MNVSRRGLLGMFAASAAAAIVSPGVLMPIKPALVRSHLSIDEYVAYLRERARMLARKRGVEYDELGFPRTGQISFPASNPQEGDTITLNGTTYRVQRGPEWVPGPAIVESQRKGGLVGSVAPNPILLILAGSPL